MLAPRARLPVCIQRAVRRSRHAAPCRCARGTQVKEPHAFDAFFQEDHSLEALHAGRQSCGVPNYAAAASSYQRLFRVEHTVAAGHSTPSFLDATPSTSAGHQTSHRARGPRTRAVTRRAGLSLCSRA